MILSGLLDLNFSVELQVPKLCVLFLSSSCSILHSLESSLLQHAPGRDSLQCLHRDLPDLVTLLLKEKNTTMNTLNRTHLSPSDTSTVWTESHSDTTAPALQTSTSKASASLPFYCNLGLTQFHCKFRVTSFLSLPSFLRKVVWINS